MARIGSRKHAAFIYEWYVSVGEWWEHPSLPEGWSLVGSGSYRAVFLHDESNVTYKIDIADAYYDDGYDSRREVVNARRLSKSTFSHVRIPKTSGYNIDGNTVVAMEYVDGNMGNRVFPAGVREGLIELFRIGFMDMHSENFIVDNDGMVVPVDMASPARKNSSRSDIRVLAGLPEYNAEGRRRGWL